MFKIIYRVLSLLNKDRRTVFYLVIANFFFAIFILIEPIIYGNIINILVDFSSNDNLNLSNLYNPIYLWIGLGLIIISIRLFLSITSDRLSHKYYHIFSKKFYNHVLDLSMNFHLNSNSGKLVKKITKGTDSIFMVNLDFFRRTLPQLFTIIIIIPLILYLNFELGTLVVVFGLLSGGIAFYIVSKVFKKQNKIENLYTNMSSLYSDTFSNISIIKSFTLSKMKIKQLEKISSETLSAQFPILNWWGFLVSFSYILNIIISIGVIVFGSYLYLKGKITIGDIVMFLSFSTIFLASIESLMWSLESMFWRLSSIKDFLKILDTKITVKDKDASKTLNEVKGNVNFNNLSFSYDGKRDVIKNINFKVLKGEKIAFVGHTGSGKTTMINLLLRFFEPQSGQIMIDDFDISEITQDSLRKNIGVVFQDNTMFNTTILNNIKLDKLSSKLDIEKVTKKANCFEFINNLSNGFDTIVGERGIKLSGGEKQRLAIARAFLKDAPILILDEATSALDTETEKYIQNSFDELMEGRTTFIIAHRLSTIRKVDKILVFNKGKIIESGTYEDLYKKGGYFTRLVNSQVKGFIE